MELYLIFCLANFAFYFVQICIMRNIVKKDKTFNVEGFTFNELFPIVGMLITLFILSFVPMFNVFYTISLIFFRGEMIANFKRAMIKRIEENR